MDREKAVPARVVAQSRGVWRVAGNFGESAAEATGKLRLAAEEGADWPAVGDWVAAELQDQGGAAMIREVLPRRSQFVRKMAGKKPAEQVIAANVDTALLVSALDGDFNPRRVERYLAQCWESGAKPVIILNKADACECLEEKVDEIEKVGRGVPVCAVSAKTAQGFEELVRYLGRGQTLVLLGSSGVGKSTIVNRLLGRDLQEVEQVRESDSRGRHTTTARQLFALPGGALPVHQLHPRKRAGVRGASGHPNRCARSGAARKLAESSTRTGISRAQDRPRSKTKRKAANQTAHARRTANVS